jgi:hypothetical protein
MENSKRSVKDDDIKIAAKASNESELTLEIAQALR